jgi:hypothetical protein
MALLNYDIPESNLEAIRDQIAIIAKAELDNQATRQTNDDLSGKVFIERFTPFNKSEGTCMNVYIDRGNFTQQTQVTQRGEFNFFIDIFTWDTQTDSEEGGYRSARKLHRIAGLLLNIFQSPVFNTLGFDPGIIYNRTVTNMIFDNPINNQDQNFARMGRVTISVDFHNQQPFESPITASGYDTSYKIGMTDDGYQIITNN